MHILYHNFFLFLDSDEEPLVPIEVEHSESDVSSLIYNKVNVERALVSFQFSVAVWNRAKNADGKRSNKLAALVNQELNVILIDELLDETDL